MAASPVAIIAALVVIGDQKGRVGFGHGKAREVPGMLEEAVEQLDQGLDAVYRAQQTIEAALAKADFDPRELERAEERLFALRAASRKYGVAVENLPELAVRLADDLEALVSGEDRLQALQEELQAL